MSDVLTPEQFCSRMLAVADSNDIEASHVWGEDLMCEVLTSLGYGQGVAVFEDMEKWYA